MNNLSEETLKYVEFYFQCRKNKNRRNQTPLALMNVNVQNATALGSFSAKALEPVTEEGMRKTKVAFLHAVAVVHTERCSIKSKTVPEHLSQRS